MGSDVALVEVHEKNLASQGYVVGNDRSVLIAFSDKYGYSFLILYQNKQKMIASYWLVAMQNLKLLSTNFSSCYNKNPPGHFELEYSFYPCLVLSFHEGHLENTGSLSEVLLLEYVHTFFSTSPFKRQSLFSLSLRVGCAYDSLLMNRM